MRPPAPSIFEIDSAGSRAGRHRASGRSSHCTSCARRPACGVQPDSWSFSSPAWRCWPSSATPCLPGPPGPGSSTISRSAHASPSPPPDRAWRPTGAAGEPASRRRWPTSRATSASWRCGLLTAGTSCWQRPIVSGRVLLPLGPGADAARGRGRRRLLVDDRRAALGRVHLSVTTLGDRAAPLGAVVLVHDLSYLSRREATTRNFLALRLLRALPRRLGGHAGGRAARLARLDPRAAPGAHRARPPPSSSRWSATCGRWSSAWPASASRRHAPGRGAPARLRSTLTAVPPGRAGRHPRQPRALHPRARPTAGSGCSTRPAAWSRRSSR